MHVIPSIPLIAHTCQHDLSVRIQWLPPNPGENKINVDGVVSSSNGVVGVDIVI